MNDDLISRQDAIDALREEVEWEYDEKDEQWYYIEADMAIGAIERLPSAQLEERTKERTKKRTETHACDLISRAAAIYAIVNTVSDVGLHDNSETARYGATFRQQEILTILESLPSADRPKGKWLPYLPEGLRYKCSECGSKYETPWHFCPNCGSYNGGENHDKG